MNSVQLVGRLTAEPELRYTAVGKAVVTFTVAVPRPKAEGEAKPEADFISGVAWGPLAESMHKYLVKGQRIALEGRIQVRNYETQDGQKRRAVEVVAHRVDFLDKPRGAGEGSGSPSEEPPPPDDDDVPF